MLSIFDFEFFNPINQSMTSGTFNYDYCFACGSIFSFFCPFFFKDASFILFFIFLKKAF